MKESVKPYLALLFCNTVWALDYPMYKILLPKYISPVAMCSSALLAAGCIGLLSLLFDKHPEHIDKHDIWRFIVGALLMGVFRKVCLMEGMSRTSPIDGSIINTVIPLLVLLVSVMVGMDSFNKRKIIGLVLGMAGAVIIVVMSASGVHHHSTLTGDLLIVGCAVSSALYMIWFKKLVAKYRPLTLLRWLYVIAGIVMFPFGIKDIVQTDYSAFTTSVWPVYFFVLLLPSFFPNLMLVISLKYVSPTVSSMFTYLQPILATVVSMSLGMDKLNWDSVLGAVLIFCGVFIVIKSYGKPSDKVPVADVD